MFRFKPFSAGALACAWSFLWAVSAQAQMKPVPLCRLLYDATQRHVYTVNKEETYVISEKHQGYNEGIAGYVMPELLPGLVPLYYWKSSTGSSYYTLSTEGHKGIIPKTGYQGEGIVGYVSAQPAINTTPFYRLYRAAKSVNKGQPKMMPSNYDDHYYTASIQEKQGAMKQFGYIEEGIEGYLWTQPIPYTAGGEQASGYHSPKYDKAAQVLIKVSPLYYDLVDSHPDRIDTLIGKLRMAGGGEAQFQAGLTEADAHQFFFQLFKTDAAERRILIDNVLSNTYGPVVMLTKAQTAEWDSKLAGGATLAQFSDAERSKLNGNPELRRTMIERAYIWSMGRKPIDRMVLTKGMSGDQTYWGPRAERYDEIVAASRQWLYSPAGANDLTETVRRALKMKKDRAPTPAELEQAKLDFKAPKFIFMQMIAPINSFYSESVIHNAKPEPGIKVVGGSQGSGSGRPAPILPK